MQLLIQEKAEAFPKILTRIWNQAMIVEHDTHLGAKAYERSAERDGYANGFKPRSFQALAGKLDLQVPQVRGSSTPFYPKTLDKGSRSERPITLAAAEMYVHGVSTRRVETVFRNLGIEHFSAEQVSNHGPMRIYRQNPCVILWMQKSLQKMPVGLRLLITPNVRLSS